MRFLALHLLALLVWTTACGGSGSSVEIGSSGIRAKKQKAESSKASNDDIRISSESIGVDQGAVAKDEIAVGAPVLPPNDTQVGFYNTELTKAQTERQNLREEADDAAFIGTVAELKEIVNMMIALEARLQEFKKGLAQFDQNDATVIDFLARIDGLLAQVAADKQRFE